MLEPLTSTDHDTPFLGDIPPDEFHAQARRVIRWIADYLENPERFPVLGHGVLICAYYSSNQFLAIRPISRSI